jgi:hypothetical protein
MQLQTKGQDGLVLEAVGAVPSQTHKIRYNSTWDTVLCFPNQQRLTCTKMSELVHSKVRV